MLIPLVVALSLAAPSTIRADDPPVQLWIDPDHALVRGDRVRVHVRTAEDAYVVVLVRIRLLLVLARVRGFLLLLRPVLRFFLRPVLLPLRVRPVLLRRARLRVLLVVRAARVRLLPQILRVVFSPGLPGAVPADAACLPAVRAAEQP